MCLAVPGMVAKWLDRTPYFARANVEFGSISREVNMQCLPDAAVGDFVLVHAGISISRIDADEAQRLLAALDELELAELASDNEANETEPRR